LVVTTNDPPQDICNHVRSQILSFASKLTTKELMELPAAEIIKQIHDQDHEFYRTRGVSVSRINILEKKCADVKVDETYNAIINQKITRARNLEQQLGENDKEIARIDGLTKTEAKTYDLLQQKLKNLELETETSGKAEGGKIKSFLDGLGDDMSMKDKLDVLFMFEKTKRMALIAEKVKTLYLNPEDVDFNLNVIRLEEKDDGKVSVNQLLDSDLPAAKDKKISKNKTSLSLNLNQNQN
jgi:hypothetical protein